MHKVSAFTHTKVELCHHLNVKQHNLTERKISSRVKMSTVKEGIKDKRIYLCFIQ